AGAARGRTRPRRPCRPGCGTARSRPALPNGPAGSAGDGAGPLLRLAQVLVHEGDRHAALADGRRHALDGPEADVAAGEDAGDARLEQVRVALELPAVGARQLRAGEHVPAP